MDFVDLALFFRMSATLARLYGGGHGCFTPVKLTRVTKIHIINRVSTSLCRNFGSAAPGSRIKKFKSIKITFKNRPPQPDRPVFLRFFIESWHSWVGWGRSVNGFRIELTHIYSSNRSNSLVSTMAIPNSRARTCWPSAGTKSCS